VKPAAPLPFPLALQHFCTHVTRTIAVRGGSIVPILHTPRALDVAERQNFQKLALPAPTVVQLLSLLVQADHYGTPRQEGQCKWCFSYMLLTLPPCRPTARGV